MAEVQKLFREMTQSLETHKRDLQVVQSQINIGKRNVLLNEATAKELKGYPAESTTYKGCGKAFLSVSRDAYDAELSSDATQLQEQLKALEIKRRYLETSIQSDIDNINKLNSTVSSS